MKQWKEVWIAYHSESTFWKILLESWHRANRKHRLGLSLLVIIFIGSIVLWNIQDNDVWASLTILSGIISMPLLKDLENQLILNGYGGQDEFDPSMKEYSNNKYSIFKKRLQDKNITKSQLEKCFVLIDYQIDIAITDSRGIDKLYTFSLSLLTAGLIALWSTANFESVIIITAVLIVIFRLVIQLGPLFPSKTKKLKEMRYFMHLYCHNYNN